MLVSVVVSAQQQPKGLTAASGEYIGFLEHLPADYNSNPSTRYPLIIFLHGIGERGNGTTDLQNITANGIPKSIKNGHPMKFFWNGKWESFIVLSPQLSYNYGDWPDFYVDAMIKYARQNLRIDEHRIILTGLSLGGGGVWAWSGNSLSNAKSLAAIGVSCGVCRWTDYSNIAKADLPVWAFHAENDGTVGVGCTTSAVDAINQNNPDVKPYMTIWPDGYHWIWDRVYDTEYSWQNPNIYEWFLGQNNALGPNKRPKAKAGNEIKVNAAKGTATLDASGSKDQDGNIVRYIWRQVSGPASATIANEVSTSATTAVSGLTTEGTYQFEVRVVDNRADWTTDVVNVRVSKKGDGNDDGNGNGKDNGNGNGNGDQSGSKKKPPVAVAGSPVTITLPTSSAALYGTGSYDNDGYITSYQWTKASGPSCNISNPNSANTNITNLVQGTYQFSLRVTDNNGNSATASVGVTVNAAAPPPVNPPVAVAGSDVTITLPTNTAALNGNGSYQTNGSIQAYKWEKIQGPQQGQVDNSSNAYTTLSNLTSGTYKFRLTVWDNSWTQATSVVTVTVNPAPVSNKPPVAVTSGDATITAPASSVNVSGSASYKPNGSILAYKWEKASGPSQYNIANPGASNTTISNLLQGTYQFKLTVWDDQWTAASSTLTITVNAAPAPSDKLPVAKAGNDITITVGDKASLNGTGSYDPDGYLIAYKWAKINGPNQGTISNENASYTTVSNLAEGTYIFQLTVWDNLWAASSDFITVTVKAKDKGNDNGGGSTGQSNTPVAKANPDFGVTLPVNNVSLSSSGSWSPNGSISYFKWEKVSGPSANIASPDAASTLVRDMAAGQYAFKLTVWDNFWISASTIVNVVINQPPVPVTASEVNITWPQNNVMLYGSNSYDPDGSLFDYKWEKIDGPSQYKIAKDNDANAAISNLVQGSYHFRFTVWDNYWYPTSTTVTVNVKGYSGAAGARAATDAIAESNNTRNPSVHIKPMLYPNPVRSTLFVTGTDEATGNAVINIHDMNGRLVKTMPFNKSQQVYQQSINVAGMLPGVYYLDVMIGNKKRFSTSFLKNN